MTYGPGGVIGPAALVTPHQRSFHQHADEKKLEASFLALPLTVARETMRPTFPAEPLPEVSDLLDDGDAEEDDRHEHDQIEIGTKPPVASPA